MWHRDYAVAASAVLFDVMDKMSEEPDLARHVPTLAAIAREVARRYDVDSAEVLDVMRAVDDAIYGYPVKAARSAPRSGSALIGAAKKKH